MNRLRPAAIALVGAIAVAGCAKPTAPGLEDLALPSLGDLGAADLASSSQDLAGRPDLVDPNACTIAKLTINEVQTGGSGGATDEFVEIFNGCGSPIDLTGGKLVYRSATNSTGVDSYILGGLTGTLAPGGYFVIANTGFAGTADVKPFLTGALAATGGAVGIRDGNGYLGDHVGWGSANNPLVEGPTAPAPASGTSIARHPDGRDTDVNGVDFTQGTPSPGRAN